MPELPEIEHLRRSLVPHLIGARLAAVDLRRADVVKRIGGAGTGAGRFPQNESTARPHPHPGPWGAPQQRGRGSRATINPGELLAGCVIVELKRHGKNLAIVADSGAVLGVHLGMSGQMRVLAGAGAGAAEEDSYESLTHVHCVWRVERGENAEPGTTANGRSEISYLKSTSIMGDRSKTSGTRASETRRSPARPTRPWHATSEAASRLIFRDPRRFGGLFVFASLDHLYEHHWSRLGPDALTIADDELAAALASTKRSIKAALLDQAVLAGVGNIYADEALFAAGVHPMVRADRLKRPAVERVATEVRRVLREAVEAGGSTLRDYVDGEGMAGDYGASHRVYGRGGEPCLSCGRDLRSVSVAQRTTVFCPICQRRNR